ncbi:uncharacterized protein LOC106178172 isoform X2 [Lingula anatina]|nr:uncharacterized protein LOC106178172 isoform X2 [Lingula anatina]XP_013416698.1 uncharacterized protein LOC106178172 isoform X2 [Lingula anatina]|eukprot:XP_013416697.1 uncharacterized protein LOC106178172 isoform X2 [Lingula anatina]
METDATADNTKQTNPPEQAKHESNILDLAFAMDCTGSMGSYIKQAQQNIRKIVEDIVAAEKADVHLALVEYRDHPPEDTSFVTKVQDFTPSVSVMKKCLDACSAQGGGDTPEAVADALHQVLKLSWREEATKICVFIADAPPHGLSTSKFSDHFPKGCPDGLDPMEITHQIAEKGITIYTVGCEPAVNQCKDFFMAVAHTTGGQYVPLRNAALLAQVIIGGAQEEVTLQRHLAEVNEEVLQEAQGMEELDDEEVATKVHQKLLSKGAKTKKLMRNQAALPEASGVAKKMSAFKNMAEVQATYDSEVAVTAAPEFEVKRSVFGGKMKKKSKKPMPMSVDSPPPPMAMAMSSALDHYEVSEGNIDYAQTKRLVSKSMAQNKIKKASKF